MLGEVDATSAQDLNVLLLVHGVERRTGRDRRTTTVNLEGTDGSDNNDNVRHEAGGTALDVEETLATHGEVETGFSNDKARLGSIILIGLRTSKLEGHLVGQDGAVTNANVGEGTGVNEDRGTLQGLHEVGLDGISHQDSEGTANTKVISSDGVAALGAGNNHSAETLTHVSKAGAEGQNSHAFTGNRNVEASVTLVALLGGSIADHNAAQMTVVHVQNTFPSDGLGVNVETSKAGDLLLGEIIGVCLLNVQLLQATEHDGRELPLSVLGRD